MVTLQHPSAFPVTCQSVHLSLLLPCWELLCSVWMLLSHHRLQNSPQLCWVVTSVPQSEHLCSCRYSSSLQPCCPPAHWSLQSACLFWCKGARFRSWCSYIFTVYDFNQMFKLMFFRYDFGGVSLIFSKSGATIRKPAWLWLEQLCNNHEPRASGWNK